MATAAGGDVVDVKEVSVRKPSVALVRSTVVTDPQHWYEESFLIPHEVGR